MEDGNNIPFFTASGWCNIGVTTWVGNNRAENVSPSSSFFSPALSHWWLKNWKNDLADMKSFLMHDQDVLHIAPKMILRFQNMNCIYLTQPKPIIFML